MDTSTAPELANVVGVVMTTKDEASLQALGNVRSVDDRATSIEPTDRSHHGRHQQQTRHAIVASPFSPGPDLNG